MKSSWYRGIQVRYPPSLVTGRPNSDGQISTLVTEQLFRKSQNFHNSYWKILEHLSHFFWIFDDFLVKTSDKTVKNSNILQIVTGFFCTKWSPQAKISRFQNGTKGDFTLQNERRRRFFAVSERYWGRFYLTKCDTFQASAGNLIRFRHVPRQVPEIWHISGKT